ncbi:hypothetical protein [Evansella tamaricis]|uniref:Uncharacterized protein n=1 Tax=Evansella tamaricis TaxID=2069301 RepID=A0ABS6JLH7_9BACI|nr:hypothetical protein [Evansella tamaricis]MBU9713285.1 hypothetical protein [Evansella tamaricis]
MNSWNIEKIETRDEGNFAIVNGTSVTNDTIEKLTAGEQILVDSDRQSFVYILEDDNGFAHLRFQKNVWNKIQELRLTDQPVYVEFAGSGKVSRLELTNFKEEMNTLIDNIRGNSNYGDEMVRAVEEVFVS